MAEFEFQTREDEPLTVESVVFQALGAASVCWENMKDAGVFQAELAGEIGTALVQWLRDNYRNEPQLGLATTREMMGELVARLEPGLMQPHVMPAHDVASVLERALRTLPEGDLNYRTVGGG